MPECYRRIKHRSEEAPRDEIRGLIRLRKWRWVEDDDRVGNQSDLANDGSLAFSSAKTNNFLLENLIIKKINT